MILWLILTLVVLAECEHHQQQGCPDFCSCTFPSNSSAEVDCSQILLAQFPWESLPYNTTRLSFRSSNLTNITPAQLSLVPFLTKLQLHHTNLTSLPSDLLHGVPQLNTLDLTGNQLADFPPGIFSLESLRNLDLNDNLIEELNPDWFPFNSSLTNLDLSRNLLSNISRAFFQRLPHLEHLYLAHNQLQELREDTLWNLHHLVVMNLMRNRLTSLQPATFSHNPNLELLFLHNNRLQELPGTLLKALTKLNLLTISQNQLQNLPEGLLEGTDPSFAIILHGNPWQCDEKLKYLWKWMTNKSHEVYKKVIVSCDGPPNLKNKRVILLREYELKPTNST